MIVREVTRKEASNVLFDPEIFERVSRGSNLTPDDINLAKGTYIGGYINNALFGIVIYYDRSGFQTIHINVLKKFRGRYAYRFGKMALKHSKGTPLFTNIPVQFTDVVKFAEKLNFKLVGENLGQLIYRRD